MFKKLKDKLAEEVKSSPQRIQQFAQAAQAAVTSASSSISDITNNDLFSIGDNETQKNPVKAQPSGQKAFQDVSLLPHSVSFSSNNESMEYHTTSDLTETPRQRRLSNSSFASDVSFKLPSYESPSMYHLQSDMDVSASEAEERGLASPGGISLDRVTKEQLYAAYRRTQERYGKYRTQYADLARHYKILERDNAKARSVLVETQDKALRRISELREQCSLEQSAKAHLERALRMEIDERNMKIEALTTKIKILQANDGNGNEDNSTLEPGDVRKKSIAENDAQLIDLSLDNKHNLETSSTEITALHNKIEKMEQLMNKYKESLKAIKEKNSQLTTELQVVSNELDAKAKENEQLRETTIHLTKAREKIQELKDINEELQNKINTYDFSKIKETSTLEIDLQKAQDEIINLQSRIDIFSKREEENAISLAENKLSIHKELEGKESEIKSLKERLSVSKQELQSLTIVVNDYKNKISSLEEENSKLSNENKEISLIKSVINEKDVKIKELETKCLSHEQMKAKKDEECKCLELQIKQETAEKLAMIDRNAYLEDKNKHISEENMKKTAQITSLESELYNIKLNNSINEEEIITEKQNTLNELNLWKEKCQSLETEIQEERIELVNLQSEIEKLLNNYELVQNENSKLNSLLSQLQSENSSIKENVTRYNDDIKMQSEDIKNKVRGLRDLITHTNDEMKTLKSFAINIGDLENEINRLCINYEQGNEIKNITVKYNELKVSFNVLEGNFENMEEQCNNLVKQVTSLEEEKQILQKLIETEKERNITTHQELVDLNDQYEKKIEDVKQLNNEKQTLLLKLDDNERNYRELQSILEQNSNGNRTANEELHNLKSENDELRHKLKEQEDAYKSCSNELINLKTDLQSKIKKSDDNKYHVETLEKNIKELIDENTTLKKKIDDIVTNFKGLEDELAEVRRSHSDIEIEKDHLNLAIEAFEKRQLNMVIKETQTNESIESWKEQLDSALDENKILKSKCEQIKQEKEELYEKVLVLEQKCTENESTIEEKCKALEEQKTNNVLKDRNENVNVNELNYESLEKYDQMKNEWESLKEENRRLQSDIEGLQSYLTKISKENGILNDKLREIIASDENTSTNNASVMLEDIDILRKEILYEKTKNDNLLKENFELKDQLQIQPLENTSTEKGTELSTLKEKYKTLLKFKEELETKLIDSEIANNNVKQLQDSNQKLRFSNDKLERRLDEALVSLRHLHSLQENTELEYLKNILYEYLTGSGTHSLTLAKVLAAVVKFDEKQTQHVLQKEKERQGVLRQLGLL